ncbi:MAG: ATP-dependent Clp protease ATP-binding subunit [Synergistaceae bacterium]|nr:ATP-dependent Clp protease ATP-binding subunit [Synergistaceae bacterium]
MNKITLYYGPKREFAQLLPAYNNLNNNNNLKDEFTDFELEKPKVIMTISELAILSDKKMREHVFQIQTKSSENKQAKPENKMFIDALIGWSDQYAALSESAVQGFLSFLDQYNIEELYLQNPPKSIAEQLIKSQEILQAEIKIYSYKYNSIDLNAIKEINLNYANYIIGQEQALRNILLALYPLTRENYSRPAVLLFYGSTGVGKTETANFLSKVLKQNLFRRQLSMFNSSEFASYLFGGRHSQTCFAKDLMERESNIILLDEFDKIASAYHSAFYQIFDEGIYEDKNYAADLRRSVIICTSNYKSEQDAREHIGAPLFARFDAVIKFNDLSDSAIKQILEREFEHELKNLDAREREYIYEIKDLLREKILNLNGTCDARALKRRVKNIISNAILDKILN